MDVVQNVWEKDEDQGLRQLHLAAERGDTEAARRLLMTSANVNSTDLKLDTPLRYATLNGHVEVVDLLLSKGANADLGNETGQTSLHLVAKNGHYEIAKLLLDRKADVNAIDQSNYSMIEIVAMHCHCELTHFHLLAADRGDTDAVRSILLSPVNVNAMDIERNTPLHYASLHGHIDVVNLLLIKNARVSIRNEIGMTSLHMAAKNGDLRIVKLLLDYNIYDNAVDQSKYTPVNIADLYDHFQWVELMKYGLQPQCCGAIPLHLAAEYGHPEVVKLFLNCGEDVNVKTSDGNTPLHLATENGHLRVVQVLLRRNADANILDEGYPCETPFRIAIKLGYAEIVKAMLEHGGDIKAGVTVLRIALIGNHCSVVKVLLKHSSEMNALLADNFKLTDGDSLEFGQCRLSIENINLKHAVRSYQLKWVLFLLNKPLCQYSTTYLIECLHYLTICSARYCRGCKKFAFKSCDEQDEVTVESAKEIARAVINSNKFKVNYRNDDWQTPLHDVLDWKTQIGHLNNFLYIVQVILEKGADVLNAKDAFGQTPLIIASQRGHRQAIEILFDHEQKSKIKLDIDARDRFGETALIKAVEGKHVSVVQLLLSHNASVNLHDYQGFTALHTAANDPNGNWFDVQFFCNELRKRNFEDVDSTYICREDKAICPYTPVVKIQQFLQDTWKTTQIKQNIVELLLANEESNVNAIDFRGNTPLDLAVRSFQGIKSAISIALRNRGATLMRQRALLEPEVPLEGNRIYERDPFEEDRIDERGRNAFHRLIISSVINEELEDFIKEAEHDENWGRLDLMVRGILRRPDLEKFRKSATTTDDKGRTPLHYALMLPGPKWHDNQKNLMNVLLHSASNVKATDKYGKTPLHYAEMDDQYELLVQSGADEYIKDMYGYTPKDLRHLRDTIDIDSSCAWRLSDEMRKLYLSGDILQLTDLTKQNLVDSIRNYFQSHSSQKEAEIWKIWNRIDTFCLNRSLDRLELLIHKFIERLSNSIKEKDWRFECQPILVGSASEETKVVKSKDFDFNLKLVKFSQLCHPFSRPLDPNGYFQLKRNSGEDTKNCSDKDFDSFFNSDQCLLTDEVNTRFRILIQEVLSDSAFWRDESLFEWEESYEYKGKSRDPVGLCKTLGLRMLHPIEDGEGGLLFVNVSIDAVACVHVDGWCPEDSLPVGINPSVKEDICTLVFARPRMYPYERYPPFSDSYARISFAPLESQIIKDSSTTIKAAYIVCKRILYLLPKTTYQLKNCLLYCMEAFKDINGSETRNEEEITPQQLALWVEGIMLCFREFNRKEDFPCYFMPSLRLPAFRDTEAEDGAVLSSFEDFNASLS